MNSAMFMIGLGVLALGAVLSVLAGATLSEYQSFFGSIARSFSANARAEYEASMIILLIGIVTSVGGIGMTIYGATKNESQPPAKRQKKVKFLVCDSCNGRIHELVGGEKRELLHNLVIEHYRKAHPDKDPTASSSTGRIV
jgi:hypothetical protein